ncbi:hypothetical protein A2215_03030 [Candidatus Berkelbacteria bacterium RIFOXYA2_FULL_43_10]|uniref:Uncharacterized protein n=1 Tax=Candidatus Berkelbacteria bacterium RIFOXYA2_FULL_43_10 TaxID=1797472 RepID=A0A1F5E4Z1_9BACT|nr:MAG: hypothetical protein A2215_03030 [Candidatus Berkelbacteria bacterium RIFOXYA2_FULL_43_10]
MKLAGGTVMELTELSEVDVNVVFDLGYDQALGVNRLIGLVGGWAEKEPQLEVEMQWGNVSDLGRCRLRYVGDRGVRRHSTQRESVTVLRSEFGRDCSGGGGLMVAMAEPLIIPANPYSEAQDRIDVLKLTMPCYSTLAISRWVRKDGSIGIGRLPWMIGATAGEEPQRLGSVMAARHAARHAYQWAEACGGDKKGMLELFVAKLDWYREHPSQVMGR